MAGVSCLWENLQNLKGGEGGLVDGLTSMDESSKFTIKIGNFHIRYGSKHGIRLVILP